MITGRRSERSACSGSFSDRSTGRIPLARDPRIGEPTPCRLGRLDRALDDETAWQAANPGLGTIKSIDYMRDRARWALSNPSDAADFRAHDLNQALRPSVDLLVDPDQWLACERPSEAAGEPIWGIDLGGAASFSAVAAFWPATGALRVRTACPNDPPLAERGERDGVGRLYTELHEAGELLTLGQRTCDVAELIRRCASEWGPPVAIAGDRYRGSEMLDALEAAGIAVAAWTPRGQGWRDGAEDVRDFRAAVLERRIAAPESAMLRHAFSGAVTITDTAGNAKLARGGEGGRMSRHRDDTAAATVLAVALGRRMHRAQEAREPKQGGWIVFPGAA